MATLVKICHFYDPEEAYCAKSYLVSGGIHVSLQNEYLLTVNPALRIALGGYRLMVPDVQAGDARELLSAIKQEEHDRDKVIADSRVCTQCGHEGLPRKRNWFWFPIAFLQGIPFVPYSRKITCPACGKIQPT